MSRSLPRSLFTYCLISSCSLLTFNSAVFAQIIPDQTTATEVKGNVIAPVGAGTVSGGNLFNSFEQFNVPQSGVVFSTGNSTVDGTKINNILNRVTGDNPSQILGTIESRAAFPNANLFLLNPNGVVFGQNAKLDIGGSFNVTTATGLGFAGDRTFSVDKASLEFPSGNPQNIKFAVSNPAAIINQGNLTVDAGKNITFTAGSVINSGILTAPSGNVAIASVSGGSVVDLRSPDLVLGLSVLKDAIPANWNGNITTLPKLAELLTGKATEGDRVVVKPDGSLAIVVSPASNDVPVTNGTTIVSGLINASSVNTDGGKVGIFGDRVAIINSQISATGVNGGTVLIGGDLQGKGIVPNALFTYFDNKSVVDVSALTNGNGGKVIVWGDITTQFLGTILSKGGTISGDGGFVEVSGKENLLYLGNVDTSASNGNFGTLLLDPTNITIVATGGADNSQLAAGVPTASDPASVIFFNDASTSNFTINSSVLSSATSNIILQATNDINFNDGVAVGNPNISFTAQAGNDINFANSFINTNRGNINLTAGRNITGTGLSRIFSTIATTGNSGNIDLQAGGAINGIEFRTSTSSGGNAGNITLLAAGNITVTDTPGGGLTASTQGLVGGLGNNVGGNISITSTGGSIVTSPDVNTSAFTTGRAGNIFYQAAGNITTASVSAQSAFDAANNVGNITLISSAGSITTSLLNTENTSGIVRIAGDISLQAKGNITIGGVRTGNGGDVTFISSDGAITAPVISTRPPIDGGTGGNVLLQALGNINIPISIDTSTVNGNSGKISVISTGGAIDASSSASLRSDSSGTSGNSGDILLSAAGNITTGNNGVVSAAASTNGNAGNITYISSNGSINSLLGGLDSRSTNGGNGGYITLNALNGNITTGAEIRSATISATSTSGSIALNALNLAIGGLLNTSAQAGKAGDLTLGGNIPLATNVTFSTNSGGINGNINLANANVTGSQALTLNAGTGNISLGAIGTNAVPLTNLSLTSGSITLNKDIFVNAINPLTFSSPVTLDGSAPIISINSPSGIVFGNTVNGNHSLLLNAGSSSIFFNGIVGGITRLSGLLTNANSTITSTGAVDIRTAFGGINTGNITNNGRDVTINSIGGISIASINVTSTSGNGGNVNVQSGENFTTTGNFTSDGVNFYAIATNTTTGNGGNISLVSNTGEINTSSGDIQSATNNGNAGNITIQAENSIITAGIFATTVTSGNGGAISLNSTNGRIESSRIDSGATNGNAGSLTLNALGNLDNIVISVNDIGSSTSNGIGGLVTLRSSGEIVFGRISSRNRSGNGTSGNIDLQAVASISSTGSINIGGQDFSIISANSGTGNGGNISLISDTINTSSANVSSSAIVGNAGNITFQAINSIVTADLLANTTSKGNGGTISISQTGANGVLGGEINTGAVNGGSGNVTIQANGNINLSNILTNNLILLEGTNSSDLNGGDVSLTSTVGNITVGKIDTSTSGENTTRSDQIIGLVSFFGRAGNINIQALGDINLSQLLSSVNNGDYTFPKIVPVTIQQGNPPVDVIVNQTVNFSENYYFGFNGDISLTSASGNVNSNFFITGNNVSIQSFDSIKISNIDASILSLTSTKGSIETDNANGSIRANNKLTVLADNSINLPNTFSNDISLTSTNGNVTAGDISTGTLTIQALDSISTSSISGFGFGGNISLISTNGNVTTGYLDGSVNSGGVPFFDGGNITIQAKGDIKTTGNVAINGIEYAIATFTDSGNGGNISLISDTGAIDVSSGRVNSASTSGISGSITFQAAGNITTGAGTTPNPAVASFVSTGGNGTPNAITFTSTNGAINTSAGDIDAGGGNITFVARNNITTSGVFSRPLNSTNRTISLTSQLGAIDTSAGDLTTTNFTGNGGNITLLANGNITTKGVFASGDNGKISITSNTGSIDTSKDTPTSIGSNNSITLKADQNIKAANIIATGNNTTISIASTKGTVDTTLGFIQGGITSTQTGNGGNITIQAAGDILTGTINAPNLSTSSTSFSFNNNAGSVFLTSSNGKVQFTGISARRNGGGGNGGNITVQAQGDIISTGVLSFGNVTLSNASTVSPNTQPRNISLTSNAGKIDVSSGAIGALNNSFQSDFPLGKITFKSSSDIIIGDINGAAVVFGASSVSLTTTGSGAKITTGNISVNTQSIDPGSVTLNTSGDITTKDINTSSLFSDGNSISLTSRTGAVTTGNLNASGGNNGANVVVIAETAITTGAIAAQGSRGRGGNVILDPVGNVTFTSINATGNITLGGGGNINIVSTGGNVLGTGIVTFATGDPCAGATICTNGSGTVSIQHGITSPFDLNTFLVGGATTNGTVGTILAGGGSLVSLRGIPNGAGFFTQGNISISPGGGVFIPPVTPTPTPTPTPTTSGDRLPTTSPINPIIIATSTPVIQRGRNLPTIDISEISRKEAGEYLAQGNLELAFEAIERGYVSSFENYLGETLTLQIKNLEQIQADLDKASNLSGSLTTTVYPLILGDRLELLIIPPKALGKPFREFVNAAKQSEITPIIQDFANNIRDTSSEDYLAQSQKLYDWLVRPYSDRLQTLQDQYQKSDMQPSGKQLSNAETQPKQKLPPTLVFVMDGGLRVIPVAALHDGKQFLIEKYALANLPYLRATRLETRDHNLNSILAMGLTESMQGFAALPSVKIEVSAISSQVLKGNSYLDQEFTVNNLQDKRRQGNYAILHLATHAQFISNESQGAFIQFWNERLSIDRVPSLRFDSPLIEMLTLSACQTAVGQNLGLGGLSISSGAKSVLASLWEVSDSGTAPLMIQFYNSFPENITKAIALQRAQISMIKGGVTIRDGKIMGIPNLPAIPLSQTSSAEVNLEHPFFWSSFILIGNWL